MASADLTVRAQAGGLVPPALARLGRRRAGGGAPPLLTIVGLATGLVFLAPVVWLIDQNLELGSDVVEVATDDRTLGSLWRTVELAAAVSLSAAVVGTTLAWLVIRTDLPGRRVVRLLAPLPLVFPSFVAATALIAGFAKGGLIEQLLGPLGVDDLPEVRGFRGAFVALTLFTYPYVYLPVAARLSALPPSLEESARLLGHGPWSSFRKIVLPQISSSIGAGSLLVALYAISEFGATALLRYDTLTVRIYENRLYNRPAAMAASLVLAALALLVVTAERTTARFRPPATTMGNRPAMTVPLGRWKLPSLAVVGAVLFGALAAPVAVLSYWAIRGLVNDRTTTLATDPGALALPAWHTITLGVVTAVVAVTVLLPLAFLVGRHRSRAGGVANTMVVAGFAMPGLIIALSLVWWVLEIDVLQTWYQTLPVVVAAYVLHFGAQAARTAQIAVAAVPTRLDDAAKLLGAGLGRRLTRIDLPLMAPGLAAGMGLVLLSTMKELPATLLLAPPDYNTLATRIWSATDAGRLAQASFGALALVLLSGVLTWLLVIRAGETAHG